MSGVKGMKHRKPRPKKQRDEYAVARIEELLTKHMDGEIELSATQLKAMEIRYSRLRPTLSAVESTVHDTRDAADPAALAARLAALFHEKPALFDQVMALRSAANAPREPVKKDETRVTH